jgi:Sigma-70 region 2
MLLPQRVSPDSMTEFEVAPEVLPRDRTSAVTALFEEHYASLVRMARLLVDDRETAEDVVMDAFTSLYRRWTAVRDRPRPTYTYAPASSTAPGASYVVAGCDAATKAKAVSRRRPAMATRRTKPTAAP